MKEFKKYYRLPATPEEVYIALTNPFTIELWTGEQAEMSTEPGAEFSMWGGSIVGKNLEFEENKKIIQQWYFEGQADESIVTIKLHPDGKDTSMEIKHVNIPDEAYKDISEGWSDSYIAALEEFFNDRD